MNDEITIEPLEFYGKCGCLKCMKQLVIVDVDTSLTFINKLGQPIKEETVTKTVGYCPVCKARYPVLYIDGAYTTYSDSYRILLEARHNERIQKERESRFRQGEKNPLLSKG